MQSFAKLANAIHTTPNVRSRESNKKPLPLPSRTWNISRNCVRFFASRFAAVCRFEWIYCANAIYE